MFGQLMLSIDLAIKTHLVSLYTHLVILQTIHFRLLLLLHLLVNVVTVLLLLSAMVFMVIVVHVETTAMYLT